MKFGKVNLPLLAIISMLYCALPGAALSGMEAGSPAVPGPSPESRDVENVVVKPVEPAAIGVLEKSEADRTDLEKKLIEMTGREQQMRDEVTRLTAEKEAIEKACPGKEGTAVKSKPAEKTAKKKSAHKWWVTGDDAPKRKSSSAAKSGKSTKSKKPVKAAKKSHPVENKKYCNGSPVSLAVVKKALSGDRKLAGENLNGLNLAGMDFTGVDLQGACLMRTNLERANLADADLERADLSGANLDSASLRLANINAVKFDGASLGNTIWSDSRICPEGSIGICREGPP